MNLSSFHKALRIGVLLLGCAFALLQSSYVKAGQGIRQRPKLILVLAIDQMRFDYLARFDDLYQGGLRTLIDEGAVFTNARYRYASTWTGPGHAVILSGRYPSSSGIVFNQWYDRFLGREIDVVRDPFHDVVPGSGVGSSPVNFIGSTLGDVLKQSSPESKVVGVSLKDDAAVLMAGPQADAAYWYDVRLGEFVSSTYYMDEAPRWLVDWNVTRGADSYSGRQWTRLIEDVSVYESYAGPDVAPGERMDSAFPHLFEESGSDADFYFELGQTPFADEMTLDVALEVMAGHEMGTDEYTDILAIGFSGTDRVGHRYGPGSQELLDQLLRLDSYLEQLFVWIDEKIGMESVLVVTTADHGVQPLAETLQAEGIDAHHASSSVFREAVDAGLRQRFNDSSDFVSQVRRYGDGVYLNAPLIADRGLARSEVEQVIITALMETGLVAAIYTQEELVGNQRSGDSYIDLYRNSFFSSRSPHLSIRLNPNVYMDDFPTGTGHGTPYDYDRHVPIVLMGPGVTGGSYSDDSGPSDIAPTLAEILGLDYPKEPDARILSEALQ